MRRTEDLLVSDPSDTPPSETPAEPLVSVVTVCLNAGAHIRNALESVAAQTYPRVEHIVVDGGSTDDTMAIVREFEEGRSPRLRWISEPDNGLYDAMNKGVAMATGALIGTLNADDSYEPDSIERVVRAWRERPDAGVIYGDLRAIDAEGHSWVLEVPDTVTVAQMRTTMTLHHPATFLSAGVYESLGDYDTRYRIAADYDLLLRALEAGVRFKRVPGVLTNFSLEGVSNRAVREADRETTRVRIAHGVSPVSAWARFYKSALASRAYGTLAHNSRFRASYDRFKGAK